MTRFSMLASALLLAPLFAAPAAGNMHETLSQVADREFVLVMNGHEFNGREYPDTPLLEAFLGERVRFTVVSGGESHTFHLHGHPWFVAERGRAIDTILLDAGEAHRFVVQAGGPDKHAGDWMYHCHVEVHQNAGMWGIFRVYPFSTKVLLPVDGTMQVRLDRLGEPVEGATLAATLDGAPVAAHATELGAGQYALHAALPPDAKGALVVTATHALGVSVARIALGGATLPAPTVQAENPGIVVPHGHGGA